MTTIPPAGRHELAVLARLLAYDEPFTARCAIAQGASYVWLRRWCGAGLLAHPVRGVYHRPDLEDDLTLRLRILTLVVPAACVVTDRTAAWLWGANMILAPGDHEVTPPVSVFSPPGYRLRNTLVNSGERQLGRSDVVELAGVRVTTPVRTACDLGRSLHRDQALAALDSIAALGRFTADDLASAVLRFRGYRGVVQLRTLAPLVDPRSESPGESILRLRWLDAGLPRPRCQVPIPAPGGGWYLLDMGLEEERFAAEYDGAAYHGEGQRPYDESRRAWARDELGWTIVVARRDNVHGRNQDAEARLREAWQQHQK